MKITQYIILILLCGLLAGCSTVLKNTNVIDAVIRNDQLVLLLNADRELDYGYWHHGITPQILNQAFGVGVCDLTNAGKMNLTLVGKRDSSGDQDEWNGFANRLCSTEAYLSITKNHIVKKYSLANHAQISQQQNYQGSSGQFVADRFCLPPNCQTIVGCSDKPFVLGANTLEPTSLKSAVQCADILCEFWTNRLELEQIAAVGNDLKTIAIQTKKGIGWHQFTTWNLQRGGEPRTVKVEGDIISLEAAQLVDGKVWILYSSVIGGVGPSGHTQANIVDEDGVVLGKTEMFEQKPVVDSDFNRVVLLKRDGENLHIKVWHPKQNKEEVFDVSMNKAFNDLYRVWRK